MTVRVAEEIRAALDAGRGVVALETSVISQGLPPPRNVEAAEALEEAVRAHGAFPAWVWVGSGAVQVGAAREELDALVHPKRVAKVARRDLPAAVAGGGLGATTVSATLWAAGRIGIPVMATGGIGGVHPGSGDVSADLVELSRTPGLVVCSGPKSIVDPAATVERLEELGVAVLGYRSDLLPFFVVAEVDVPVGQRIDTPGEAAAALRAARELGTPSALVLCNRVPPDRALVADVVAEAVDRCQQQAEHERVAGKELTPYLLRCLAKETAGASLEANLALLRANADLAAEIAVSAAVGV